MGLADKWDGLSNAVRIAMVGKYTGLSDAYLSVLKALQHACLAANHKLDILWVEASHLEDAAKVQSSSRLTLRSCVCLSSSPAMHMTCSTSASLFPLAPCLGAKSPILLGVGHTSTLPQISHVCALALPL